MKFFICFLLIFLPFRAKRFLYKKLLGYEIHYHAKIGMSLVFPGKLTMDKNSKIGHFSVIKGVAEVALGESASIGNLNWISGFPLNTDSLHFSDQLDRRPKLKLGMHSAITNRHLIDCTDSVIIGCFSTFAGFRSQILTHSVSISEARQRSGPVTIGDYTFVGTGCIFLPNASLPSFSVLAAGSVLNKAYHDQYWLYAGSPARPIKQIEPSNSYFTRKTGFII